MCNKNIIIKKKVHVYIRWSVSLRTQNTSTNGMKQYNKIYQRLTYNHIFVFINYTNISESSLAFHILGIGRGFICFITLYHNDITL